MNILNKIFIGAGIAALVTFAASCDLTSETQSSFEDSVVFANYDLAEYCVIGISEIFGETNSHRGRYLPWYGYNTDVEMYVSTTDDDKGDLARYDAKVNNSQMNLSNGPWVELYAGIERANLCIDGLRTYGNTDSDSDMAFLLGEALTMRALLYLELIKAFGDVPARFEPIDVNTIYVAKSSRDVVFEQILADLEEAFDYLPWPGETTTVSTTDRVSLAFAKGLYARIGLIASGYALRPDDGMEGTGDTGTVRLTTDENLSKDVLYPKILDALEDVINSGSLSLQSDYEAYWQDFNNMDITAGKETIYVIPFSDTRGRWNYTFAVRAEGTLSFIGSSMGSSDTRGGQAGPAPYMYWKYDAHDQRRDVSCVNTKWVVESGSDKQELAGVGSWYFGKFRFDWMTTTQYSGGNDDGIKPVYMRYADILLMAAEVANELGDLSTAKEYLLQVRQRAYAGYESEATSYVNSISSQDDMFDAIVEERALEFVGEMLRKEDLIRWNMLGEKLDYAIEQTQLLFAGSAPYNTFGPYIYYKENSDGSLDLIGYDVITTADDDYDGYEVYTSDSGTPKVYFTIDEDSSSYTRATQDFWYTEDPDTRQFWPIFQMQITTGQGYLVNDYGY